MILDEFGQPVREPDGIFGRAARDWSADARVEALRRNCGINEQIDWFENYRPGAVVRVKLPERFADPKSI